MRTARLLALGLFLALGLAPARASAPDLRQYYDGGYTYSPTYNYYYVRYYYKPYPTYASYDYHYCIYYPRHPNYIYYYNPTRQVYWGRYEIGSKGEKRYSLLAEKDRKKELKDIPESAFPELGAMPLIPDSKDEVQIEPPPEDVPKAAKSEKP